MCTSFNKRHWWKWAHKRRSVSAKKGWHPFEFRTPQSKKCKISDLRVMDYSLGQSSWMERHMRRLIGWKAPESGFLVHSSKWCGWSLFIEKFFLAKPEWPNGRYSAVLAAWIRALNLHQCLWTHLRIWGSKRLGCRAQSAGVIPEVNLRITREKAC